MRSLAVAALAACFLLGATGSQAADVPGSKDPPQFKRYEGSQIIGYVTRAYDSYTLFHEQFQKTEAIEGAITRIIYRVPPGHTTLELLRNYEAMLKDAGFAQTGEFVVDTRDYTMIGYEWKFYGQGALAAGWNIFTNNSSTNPQPEGPMAYVTAKATKGGQDINVAMMVAEKQFAPVDWAWSGAPVVKLQKGDVVVVLDVVSSKSVEQKMVVVTAADMASALNSKGSIDLYGIYFDTDKTDIKPESTKTLDEIANLLKIDQALKLEIAGHTDSTGTKEHNMQLSEGRAKAVVDALVGKYGIDASRLVAKGYGDTKPVASNDTADGKAKNRRVTLAKLKM